jgi:hypothetical protein
MTGTTIGYRFVVSFVLERRREKMTRSYKTDLTIMLIGAVIITLLLMLRIHDANNSIKTLEQHEATVAALTVRNAELEEENANLVATCTPRFNINDVINALSHRGLSPRAQELASMTQEEYEAEKRRLGIEP